MPPSDAQETTNTKHEDRFNDYNETRREQSRPVDIDRGQSIPEDLQTRSIIGEHVVALSRVVDVLAGVGKCDRGGDLRS